MEEESEKAKKWIFWCKENELVKCIESAVPEDILPKNYKGNLIDVKVYGTKKFKGPDDKLYASNSELRDKVARGNCVLELHSLNDEGEIINTEYKFLIFALKKFSGGLGDEDDSNNPQNMWECYFKKPLTLAESVICTKKANGEAAHLSSLLKIGDVDYFTLGSKNVHLLARNKDDIEKYTDGRYQVARKSAEAFFKKYNQIDPIKQTELIKFLQNTKYTAVFELLNPETQHIENLSYLKDLELMFICWTIPYEENSNSLTALSPDKGIDKAKYFGFSTIDYNIIKGAEVDSEIERIREGKNYEGKVLYFLDSNKNVFGLLKKKTVWYIILRAIREKACHFSNPKFNFTETEISAKVNKRLKEIQTWIGFNDAYRLKWASLGISFIKWILKKAKHNPQTAIRSHFPILWDEFLQTSKEEYLEIYNSIKLN